MSIKRFDCLDLAIEGMQSANQKFCSETMNSVSSEKLQSMDDEAMMIIVTEGQTRHFQLEDEGVIKCFLLEIDKPYEERILV